VWLDRVKKAYKEDLDITWKNFSLEQNAFTLKQKAEGTESEWKVWEQDDPNQARSLLAQIAAEAARRQGKELHDKYHLALLTARHGSDTRMSLSEEEPLIKLAEEVGLDVGQFREDMKDPELAKKIGREHEDAVSQGIFGTPTFVFENGNTMFMKTFIPPEEDAVSEFEHFNALANHRNYIGEIKRPQPPWPKGALN
jgi:predicted DsbA family dithiol-disulfide isomerase